MKSLMEALNHPAEAFRKRNKFVAFGLVFFTVLINSVFVQVLQYYCGRYPQAINPGRMAAVTGYGILSYLVICSVFWLVCKCFGSKRSWLEHVSAWGISFFPTALCSVVVAVTEVFFYVFWNSTIWGMLLNIVFVGILIWKAILYIIYLRGFAQLKGWRFFVAAALIGIVILVMAPLNGYFGVMTPVL